MKSIYSSEAQVLAGKLLKARENAHFSQKEVAELLGHSQSYVSKIEAGQIRLDVIQLKKLARLYNVKLSIFMD